MKALIVVDYQNDFVSGSLGFEKAVLLDERIVRKIEEYNREGFDVIFTLDTHENDYLDTNEGRYLPVSHCIRGSQGWKVYGKTRIYLGSAAKVIEKPSFGSGELFDFLKNSGYESVELVGLVSNICVISNAIIAKTALPEAEVTVDASCTAGADEALHQKALDVMEGLQIKVINRS